MSIYLMAPASFFDAPINSKHYFQILCLAYDAYDALCDHYLDISFDIDEITILSETYQKSNRQLFHNPEFMVCVKKVD